jgi:hypothetical protein
LDQIWEPISGKHERSGPDQYRDTWWIAYHHTFGDYRVDAGKELFEECRGLSLLLRGFSAPMNIVPDILEQGRMERQHGDLSSQDLLCGLQECGVRDPADCRLIPGHNQVRLQGA